MPASSTAKSAAVEVGNFCATYSAKSPVKPGSPSQPGQEAFARVTEVWKSRTLDRSGASVSTFRSIPAVRPSLGPPAIFTFTSAQPPRASSATAALPSFVAENSTRS